jgi:hypothetical protein
MSSPTDASLPGVVEPRRPPAGLGARPGLALGGAIGVVGVLVVAGLFLTVSSAPGASSAALSFASAREMADPAATSAPNGPWSLWSATAFDVNEPAAFGSAFYSSDCGAGVGAPPWTLLSSAQPAVASYTGDVSAGASPWWAFLYSNGTFGTRPGGGPTGTGTLLVVVAGGVATALAEGFCDEAPILLPSSGLVSSSVAASVAWESNSTFSAAHPVVNATFNLLGRPNGSGPEWVFWFTTCSPFTQIFRSGGTFVPEPVLTATVNATSGALISTLGLTVDCQT